MKMKQTYIWVAFVLLLALNIVLMLRLSQVNSRVDGLRNDKPTAPAPLHGEEEIEVAIAMNHIQRHANKLYFAGQNSNWPLAGFYVHEMEEAMEEVAEANVVDEGVEVSKLMKAMGLPQLQLLEESIALKDKEKFDAAYLNLVNNCNACHQSTQHPYIVITLPKTPALDNQQY